jgi:hypothetical protein
MQLQQSTVGRLPVPCPEVGKDFEVLDLQHVPRDNNAVGDELSTKASMCALVPEGVFERCLQRPTA